MHMFNNSLSLAIIFQLTLCSTFGPVYRREALANEVTKLTF